MGRAARGVRYFGPYSHAWAIRETLDLLTRVFPARTCSAGVFKRHSQIERPCLLGYIDKCSAPCVGRVSAEEHRKIVLDFCDFLSGKTDRFARELELEMNAASNELNFERAARLRDDIAAIKRALEKQAVVLGDGTDATSSRSPTTTWRPLCRSSTSVVAGFAASAAGWSKKAQRAR